MSNAAEAIVDGLPKGPSGKILNRTIDRDVVRAQAEWLRARVGR